MRAVEAGEILGLAAYEEIRPHFRARVIAAKKLRRVMLGEHMSVLFENRDTVMLQVQEMLRTERITKASAIQHELDTYNALLPGPQRLSATAMIEYADAAQRDQMLERLVGVELRFYVEFEGERCFSESEARTVKASRTTAVHYLGFPLSRAVYAALIAKSPGLSIGVDHPAYSAQATLGAAQIQSLAEDFAPGA